MRAVLYILLILPNIMYSSIFIDFSGKNSYIVKELLAQQLSNVNIVISYNDQQDVSDSNFTKIWEISRLQKNNIYMLIDLGLLYQHSLINNSKNKKILQKFLNEISLQNRLGLLIDMHRVPEFCQEFYQQVIRKTVKKVVFINTLDNKKYNNQKFWDQLKNDFSIEKFDPDILYSFYIKKEYNKNLGLLFLLSLYKKNVFVQGQIFDNKYALDLIKIVSQPKLKYYAYKISDTSFLILTPFNAFGINLSSNIEVMSFQHNMKPAYRKSIFGAMPVWEYPPQMLVFPDSIAVWRLR
ncbi:hypothetical protein SAMN02745150_00015 [Brevinema andersonii]|uniref:Uncharacterized protein n=1 Tax=Brevinema andersonii TaxID=34097 RepID=A0A1I1CY83_BREAD|nr:hypothetical protein [Brevinema andersonii]SFB67052.1 hypothetical protein SAMN02745150_00015 [Brevinema andersonii]